MGNRYEILRKLGQGGMGTVYLARLKGEAGFERLVALKKLMPEAVASADLRALFEREVRLGAQLVHPNIVQVFDAGTSGSEPYLASEFVDGGDLEDVIDGLRRTNAHLSPEAVAFIGSQVCQALAFMVSLRDGNGAPLIQAHRDVSPGNVLVSRAGAVKLADFGVARLTTSNTSAAVVRGKWQYFAPEIATQDPDVRADLFALGIVMYQLAALSHPFQSATAQGFFDRASTYDPPAPEGMPDALWSVVHRALAKDAAERFQRPEALSEALDGFIFAQGKPMTVPVLARALGPLLPPPVPVAPDPALSQPFSAATAAAEPGAFEMDPEWQASGPALGADGRLVGTPQPRGAPVPQVRAPRPAEHPGAPIESLAESHAALARPSEHKSFAEVEHLELHEAPLVAKPPPEGYEPYFEPPAPRRGIRIWPVVLLLCVAAAAGGGYYAWMKLPRPAVLEPSGNTPLVSIDTEPNGAEIYSGKDLLGQTPISFPNEYAGGKLITLTVKHRGYKTREVSFVGGQPQHIKARLERGK